MVVKDDAVVLIKASKLSLKDKFMEYEPKRKSEQKFKQLLTEVIKRGVKDFYKPKNDPSFRDDGYGITYEADKLPAIGRTFKWWRYTAKMFNIARKSRLGTKSEYIAFLGVLIKGLVNEGWDIADAWNVICNNSQKLGHCKGADNAKDEFELTGSREICGFCDLLNTYKLLADDTDTGCFWIAGCAYNSNLSSLSRLLFDYRLGYLGMFSVGWIIYEV